MCMKLNPALVNLHSVYNKKDKKNYYELKSGQLCPVYNKRPAKNSLPWLDNNYKFII